MAKGINAVDPVIPKWFAVHTRFKWEKKAATGLMEKGISVYLPLQEKVKQYEKVIKKTLLPLIPNYLFVKITQSEYLKVLQQEGILGFLHNHGHLHAIPESEMIALQQIVGDWENVEVAEGIWQKGTPIEIKTGVFSGQKAFVVEDLGKKKIVIALKSIGHSFKMIVDKRHSMIVEY